MVSDDIPVPQTLDLSNLKEITEGDVSMEKQLFKLFIQCGEESLAELERICADGEQIPWKEHSHSIKGESANLGAVKLVALSQKSQEAYKASAAEKRAVLAEIKEEWAVIAGYLGHFVD